MTTMNSFASQNTNKAEVPTGTYIELDEEDTNSFGFEFLQQNTYIKLTDLVMDQTPRSHVSLLSIGNKNGYYAAGIPLGFIFGTTLSLRESLRGKATKGLSEHVPLSKVFLQKNVINVSFSPNEEYLLVTTDESHVMFYSTLRLLQKTERPLPDFSFRIDPVKDIAPNPLDDNIIAVLTFFGNLHIINITKKCISCPIASRVTSFSWSRKGKQIVCGTSDGRLTQFTPDGILKAMIPRPLTLTDTYYVSSVLWLDNHTFFVVYAEYNSLENLKHDYLLYIVNRDRNGTPTYALLVDPSPPYGLTHRIDHHYIRHMRDWEPDLKDLVILAATASADVGIIGRTKKDMTWKTLIISNDTRRISLPISILNDGDTSPIGLAFDFTCTDKFHNPSFPEIESQGVPVPIIYILNNEYLLTGYYILYLDAIKSAKLYGSMSLDGYRPSLAVNSNQPVTESTCGFSSNPVPMPNVTSLHSGPMFGNISNQALQRSMVSNPVSFGLPSLSAPSTGVPVFGSTSFGSFATLGTDNKVVSKTCNNSSSAIQASTFASFASLNGGHNNSPFGALIQNNLSQTSENNFGFAFSDSKPSFSFVDSSRFESEDIDEDKIQPEVNDLASKIEFMSEQEPQTMCDEPFEQVTSFHIDNDESHFVTTQAPSFNSFGNSSTKDPNSFSFSGQCPSMGSTAVNISNSPSYISKANDDLGTKEKSMTPISSLGCNILHDVLPKNEVNQSSQAGDFNESVQMSPKDITSFAVMDDKSYNNMQNDNNEGIRHDQNHEVVMSTRVSNFPEEGYIKEPLTYSSETALSSGGALKDNLNVSSSEFVNSAGVIEPQGFPSFSNNDSGKGYEGSINEVSSSMMLGDDINLKNDNSSRLNKSFQNEIEHMISECSMSINNTILSDSSHLSYRPSKILESLNYREHIPTSFSRLKTSPKETIRKVQDHTIKRPTSYKDQYMVKLKPLLSISEALKAQSKERGLIKELDIICKQLDNELIIIQQNIERLNQFLEDQNITTRSVEDIDKNVDNTYKSDTVETGALTLFNRRIEEWKFSNIPELITQTCDLLNDISKFHNIENTNLDAIKSLKKTFIKLEAKHIEVSRYIRARTDHEFTRLVKVRQLGSEHLEHQTRLRKICQNVEDCLWKAEKSFALFKAKLAGKADSNVKLPSLDSIRMALGKITSLIHQTTNEVSHLEDEFKKLETGVLTKTTEILTAKPSRKSAFSSDNIPSIFIMDMIRKDKFLKVLKDVMQTREPLHTTVCD